VCFIVLIIYFKYWAERQAISATCKYLGIY